VPTLSGSLLGLLSYCAKQICLLLFSFHPGLESQMNIEYFAGHCPQLQQDESFPAPLQTSAELTGSPAVPNEEPSQFKVPPGSGNQIAFWKLEHLLSNLGF